MFPWRVGITYFPSTQSHIVAPSALSRVLGKALFRAPTLRWSAIGDSPRVSCRCDATRCADAARSGCARGPRPKLIRIPIGLLWIGVTPQYNCSSPAHAPHRTHTRLGRRPGPCPSAIRQGVQQRYVHVTCTAKRRRATSDEDRGGRSSEQAQRSRRWPLCRRERHVWY